MKQIDIHEVHHILLGIAKAFVKVCDDNHVPYYMLGGTMLGAIRHKGFIPWDDDMDFGVPRKYYELLVKCLEEQLPQPYRCCTYKNGLTSSVIFKIDDTRTSIIDTYSRNPALCGLNIDIFPLDFCAPKDFVHKRVLLLSLIYRAKYEHNSNWSFLRKMINRSIDLLIPWSKHENCQKQEKLLNKLKGGPFLSNLYGAWGVKECIPVDWYGEGVKYKFEDTEFTGLKEFDKYLTQLYGDYMTPPKGDRHIHLDGVFWKD